MAPVVRQRFFHAVSAIDLTLIHINLKFSVKKEKELDYILFELKYFNFDYFQEKYKIEIYLSRHFRSWQIDEKPLDIAW